MVSGNSPIVSPNAFRPGRRILSRCAHIACILALLSPPASVLAAYTGLNVLVTEEAEQEFARHGAAGVSAISSRFVRGPAPKSRATGRSSSVRDAVPGMLSLPQGHRLANGLCAPLRC